MEFLADCKHHKGTMLLKGSSIDVVCNSIIEKSSIAPKTQEEISLELEGHMS